MISEEDQETPYEMETCDDSAVPLQNMCDPNGPLAPSQHAPVSLLYGVDDVPPWPTRLLMGFQQAMVSTSGVIAVPWLVTELVCASSLPLVRVKLIGTTLVVAGISTILQTVLGCRLPLLQGPSFAFIPPIIAMKSLPQFQCPWDDSTRNVSISEFTAEQMEHIWLERINAVQGGLIAASLVQVALGLSGVMGAVTRRIGPLTIAPLMLLLQLSVMETMLSKMSSHWISLVAIAMLILFAIYLNRTLVPVPTMVKGRFTCNWMPIFGMFPYLMAIGGSWLFAALLTVTGTFNTSTDVAARTDTKMHVLAESPWLRLPYPGQWGWPSFHTGIFLGFVGATLASVVESIGDYQACARVCAQPSVPSHAINRGIFMEGVCCFLGGWFGGSVSVTTYSENIGVIGITKIASRSIMVVGGIVFILLGIFTKFGGLLATLPDPIIGSVLAVSLSMVGGVGMSSIQLMDCHSGRNLSILGLSVTIGLLVSGYVRDSPINTGFHTFDQVLQIVLSIDMLVGGTAGFILDNTVPASSLSERGLLVQSQVTPSNDSNETSSSGGRINESYNRENVSRRSVYDMPTLIDRFVQKTKLSRLLPIFSSR